MKGNMYPNLCCPENSLEYYLQILSSLPLLSPSTPPSSPLLSLKFI